MNTKSVELTADVDNSSRCRCCLSYDFVKSMWSTHNHKGQKDVYGKIIKQCYGITCIPLEGVQDVICDECILHLRNANDFKRLVMESQDTLRFGNDDETDNELGWVKEDADQTLTVEMGNESKLDTSNSTADNAEYEEVEYSEDRKIETAPSSRTNPQWRKKQKSRSDKLIESRIILAKFKENISIILDNSNATAIRGHWGMGYTCYYCPQQYAVPAELKKHTLDKHEAMKHDITKVKSVMDLTVKVDITGLCCELCGDKINSLEQFTKHLSLHNIQYHTDIKNFILPFEFDANELKCALCSKHFETFKYLSCHMIVHYRNYDCNVCGRGFINERGLRSHRPRHQKGVFMCSYCSKLFDTHVKMKMHERNLHIRKNLTQKCGYCDERFMGLLRKSKHEVTVHGAKPPNFQCSECNRRFSTRQILKNHINVKHLLLLSHVCPKCGKAFHCKYKLKCHIETHSETKDFKCSMCSKCYTSNKSVSNGITCYLILCFVNTYITCYLTFHCNNLYYLLPT